jgi:imidazolonepropionase-like amidohydrolase
MAQQIGSPTTQDGVMPPRGVFAIRNARIVTVSGPDIENGTIVVRDGKIQAVGASVNVPAGAQIIEGRGLSVYPGMIDAGTNMGLVEVPQGANGTVDLAEVGEFNPNAKAITAVNPHSAHIAVTRVEGVTNTVTAPTGGLISGQATLINLLGTAPKEMAVVPHAGLVINYPRWKQTRVSSSKFARCCAMVKPTPVRRMRMRKTNRCRGRIRTWCSTRSCLTCAVSSR